MKQMKANALAKATAEWLADTEHLDDAKVKEGIKLIVQHKLLIASQRKYIAELGANMESLGNICSDYADSHPGFIALFEQRGEMQSGMIEIDGDTYRYTVSPSAPKRIDGSNMVQDFLAKLPKKWTKSRLELDSTAINRLGVTDDALFEEKLYRPIERTWSLAKEA